MKKIVLNPSILSADFGKLNEQLQEAKGADGFHVDIMDGHFVKNISFGPLVIRSMKTRRPLDVHLMITRPERYLKDYATPRVRTIIVHEEACADAAGTLKKIKRLGKRAGLAISPDTDVESLYPYLKLLDFVLIMTVHPGFGGQKLIRRCLKKVSKLRKKAPLIDIGVDGGINKSNIHEAVASGANVITAGSAIFKSRDIPKAIRDLRKCLEFKC